MLSAKIDPISITGISEKDVEYIFNWFNLHKQTFYTLGWSFLKNQQQMEELFYRSILKVHKELPRFKSETSFESWVTSIFIDFCRELKVDSSLKSMEETEPRQDLFKALDQLNRDAKEAVVLTYVNKLSHEEVAYLLQVSVERIKESLFSGIQSLRKEMGYESNFKGCKEYHNDYIDYLEGAMDRSKKIDLEVHIYHCQDCQEDLATFQTVMLTMLNLTERIEELHIPSGFMEKVKNKLEELEKHSQLKNKKRNRKALVLAGVFAFIMGIGFFTGVFTNLYYTWTEEDQELRVFLQQDLGERLNLKAESDGVKITIKSVIADDIQTLVFYEIEDTEEDNQFVMNYHDGVIVENEHEILSRVAYPRHYPPDLESDVNKEAKNVFQGKLSLMPLEKDTETIKLKISKLQKLFRDSFEQNSLVAYEKIEYKTGEWNFEISVTKHPSKEYVLDEETEVEGIPVRFDKLIIAPTVTILQYGINNNKSEKRIEALNFDNLEVNNKKVKADMYGSSYLHQSMDWITSHTHFDPLFGEKPKEINLQFKSVHLSYEDQNTIDLDASKKYPHSFKYAGTTISIDKVEVGKPTQVVISNHEIENRPYDTLQFRIVSEDESESISMEMNNEGVLVDKKGIKYDINKSPFVYEEIEQPRYLFTVQNIRLHSNNGGEKVVPKRLEIYGYNTTKYLDDVVKIKLD
ncbi:sigma-70 family RNA polymerase sigma factor [Peribacillus acanthi]|uniref:sigma-70 family RNA polymerase sigma factor n=1 Tax=Peribacillus acanthi TaxID=2171554 RepID=UPI000D3ED2DD|nr:sigma-70 family RNA polymerase sigma factor [Peribacillus acanthi]